MTVRNLSALFQPKSVVLIGASKRKGSLGKLILRNLLAGDFQGDLFAVNPKYRKVLGVRCYSTVAKLPKAPDLAVIVTPPPTVPKLIEQLAAFGTRAVIVITAGFAESTEDQGKALQQAMLDASQAVSLRILGPNCLGMLAPGIGLNASFAHKQPLPGNIAVLAQSGAILTTMIDWASERNIGFSHLVSLGGMADVDFGDTLNYFADDPHTRSILLYVESITQARKFMSAARAAARLKPVFVLKSGRFAGGARAAASHTGALAGRDDVYNAAFSRAGLLRVYSISELFEMVQMLAYTPQTAGDRLAIVTNGGGMGVLAADALAEQGGRLAELSPDTLAELNKALPATWSRGNPIDIIGDAPPVRYAATIRALQQDHAVDAILCLHCPVATVKPLAAAQAVIAEAPIGKKPLLASWVGGDSMSSSRTLFAEHRISQYDNPAQAVHAFMQLVRYARHQELLMETPPSLPDQFIAEPASAAAVIGHALADGREWLTEREIQTVFNAYAIPTVTSRFAPDADTAAQIAAQLSVAVALKIVSRAITHKSDVGGVVLNLQGAEQVHSAAQSMLERIREQMPQADIEGFCLQPMIHRPQACELILGVISDILFGPVLLFGHGGTAVEVINDKTLALPPLNLKLARDMIEHTRVARLLKGYRDHAPVDREAIALTLVKLSQLISDLPSIAELDINPLLASAEGVLALDARIRISKQTVSGPERLAIRPYPKELEETLRLPNGRSLCLRPIRAEDEPALIRGFERLNPEEIRLRFYHPMKVMDHKLAVRLTQIDYDREIALVLADPGPSGDIHAVVRYNADPDLQRAEFAIIIGHWMSGMGLGLLLMKRLIAHARSQGIGELFGTVLQENDTMLNLCRRLGFSLTVNRGDPGTILVRLNLSQQGG